MTTPPFFLGAVNVLSIGASTPLLSRQVANADNDEAEALYYYDLARWQSRAAGIDTYEDDLYFDGSENFQ